MVFRHRAPRAVGTAQPAVMSHSEALSRLTVGAGKHDMIKWLRLTSSNGI
jgi:hypothetical protein